MPLPLISGAMFNAAEANLVAGQRLPRSNRHTFP
jgi:hypothetical protein